MKKLSSVKHVSAPFYGKVNVVSAPFNISAPLKNSAKVTLYYRGSASILLLYPSRDPNALPLKR